MLAPDVVLLAGCLPQDVGPGFWFGDFFGNCVWNCNGSPDRSENRYARNRRNSAHRAARLPIVCRGLRQPTFHAAVSAAAKISFLFGALLWPKGWVLFVFFQSGWAQGDLNECATASMPKLLFNLEQYGNQWQETNGRKPMKLKHCCVVPLLCLIFNHAHQFQVIVVAAEQFRF